MFFFVPYICQMGFRKKLKRALARHPLLFYIRFALICRNLKAGEALPEFGELNKKEDVPPKFLEISREMKLDPSDDSLERALEISRFIRRNVQGGPGIGLSSQKTLEKMFNQKAGICSDYAQIFNVFCLANDIRVREWGCVETFYKPVYGHSFSEVYSEKLDKWVMLDVGKNLYFTRQDGTEPLSVVELFQYLRDGNPLKYVHFSDYICSDMFKIHLTYSAMMAPFIVENYDNRLYDEYLDRYDSRYPSFVINALMILREINYRFAFPLDDYRKMLMGEKRA